jgi:hypothetical protein
VFPADPLPFDLLRSMTVNFELELGAGVLWDKFHANMDVCSRIMEGLNRGDQEVSTESRP